MHILVMPLLNVKVRNCKLLLYHLNSYEVTGIYAAGSYG